MERVAREPESEVEAAPAPPSALAAHPGTLAWASAFGNRAVRAIELTSRSSPGAAVDGGRLIVVDRAGNLAFSNTVAVWDHGLAPAGTRAGAIAVPPGDASVR